MMRKLDGVTIHGMIELVIQTAILNSENISPPLGPQQVGGDLLLCESPVGRGEALLKNPASRKVQGLGFRHDLEYTLVILRLYIGVKPIASTMYA